jgi:hypothetical protein
LKGLGETFTLRFRLVVEPSACFSALAAWLRIALTQKFLPYPSRYSWPFVILIPNLVSCVLRGSPQFESVAATRKRATSIMIYLNH